MNEKSTKRLEQLLQAVDNGAVQPDELIKVIDAVMEVMKRHQGALLSRVDTTDRSTNDKIAAIRSQMNVAIARAEQKAEDLKNASTSKMEALREEIANEIARVADLIPELPPEFDATDIHQSLTDHKALLENLSSLVVGENIRNALEALPEGEKLRIDAIEDLRAELDKRQEQTRQNVTALIARNLYQIGDVDVAGATNGQVLAYNSSTNRWEATTAAGTGDMLAAVYDPQAIAGDAFDTDNHTDGTTNKVFTAVEKTKLSNIEASADVTDATNVSAAGAPIISSGAGAPGSTPSKVGDIYIDTTGDDAYIAVGTASSSDWEKSNDGAGGGISDGDKGDITVSGSGATWTIDDGVVTYAKMQDVSATDRILGRDTAGAGDVEELTPAAVRTMLNVEDGADVTDTTNVTAAGALMDSEVTNLAQVKAFSSADYATAAQGALADSASQPGHTHTKADLTDVADFLLESEVDADIKTLALPANTTISTFGASLVDDIDAATARTTLGLAIGTNVQAYDAELAALAGLTSAADALPYFTGAGTAATTTLTSAARSILDDASTSAIRTTLGVGTADSPQFTGINVGHATDTTITRTGAGSIAVEGNIIYRAGGTDVPITDGGTGASDAATAFSNLKQAASDTATGVVELATIAETNTGTDTARAVTPDGLAGSYAGVKNAGILVSDPGGDAITTGDGKVYFRVPSEYNGMNLVGVGASLSTVSSSGAVTVQVRRSRRSSATARTSADMLSTAITIDQSEFDTVDAATAAVINTSNDDVVTGDHIYIDIDGAGTGAKGLFITLSFQLP